MTSDAVTGDLLEGLWLSVADLARRKGRSRQAINERVERLVADGLLTVRRDGRSKLINLAQFDRAVGEVGDAAKEVGAQTKADNAAEPSGGSPAYRDHQAREKQYAADLKFLELEERLGNLVPVAEVAEAANESAELVVAIIGRLSTHAEALGAAAGKNGVAGVRAKCKEIEREMRQAIADAFDATLAPARANAES